MNMFSNCNNFHKNISRWDRLYLVTWLHFLKTDFPSACWIVGAHKILPWPHLLKYRYPLFFYILLGIWYSLESCTGLRNCLWRWRRPRQRASCLFCKAVYCSSNLAVFGRETSKSLDLVFAISNIRQLGRAKNQEKSIQCWNFSQSLALWKIHSSEW